ncbi:hypothetical protein [Mycobacterium sp. MMS18-G62]
MLKTVIVKVASLGVLAVSPLALLPAAVAAPSGFSNFGNAQDTVNALQAKGFNVVLNGASVYPLSSCKVLGVEGLNNSNIDSSGAKVDPTQFDTVYVDISCRGG